MDDGCGSDDVTEDPNPSASSRPTALHSGNAPGGFAVSAPEVYVVADHQDRSSARISGCPQNIGYTTPENHKIQWLMTIFAINIGTFPRKSSDV